MDGAVGGGVLDVNSTDGSVSREGWLGAWQGLQVHVVGGVCNGRLALTHGIVDRYHVTGFMVSTWECSLCPAPYKNNSSTYHHVSHHVEQGEI